MRWDREKLPKPDLHMYSENGTKIMVYNMKSCPKKGDGKNREKESLRNITAKGKTLYS